MALVQRLLKVQSNPLLRAKPRPPPISPWLQSMSQGRNLSFSSYIVTPKELSEALTKNVPTKISTAPRVIPLCAAWFLPNDLQGSTGKDVFKKKRIPSARFFDLDEVKDQDSPYPHMLPTADVFAEAMKNIGIRRDDVVVVYDTEELGIFSAPRVGWTLKVFGHPSVHVLNNFRLWVQQGLPTETGKAATLAEEGSHYPIPSLDPGKVVKFAEMKDLAKDHNKEGREEVQVLDARPKGRWAGTDPEPRPGLYVNFGVFSFPLDAMLQAVLRHPRSASLRDTSRTMRTLLNMQY